MIHQGPACSTERYDLTSCPTETTSSSARRISSNSEWVRKPVAQRITERNDTKERCKVSAHAKTRGQTLDKEQAQGLTPSQRRTRTFATLRDWVGEVQHHAVEPLQRRVHTCQVLEGY